MVDAPFLTTAERIETLYLATLSRKPRRRNSPERQDSSMMRSRRPRSKDANANALADVFWALLNSPEFILNH